MSLATLLSRAAKRRGWIAFVPFYFSFLKSDQGPEIDLWWIHCIYLWHMCGIPHAKIPFTLSTQNELHLLLDTMPSHAGDHCV